MATRKLKRTTNVVHQMKETTKGIVTTKCGLEGKRSPTLRVSSWSQDITCTKCVPPKKRTS